MHKRGISLILHHQYASGYCLQILRLEQFATARLGSLVLQPEYFFSLGHYYWSPSLFYGYAAGYLARTPRRGCRSTRIWTLIYGLAIFERMGVVTSRSYQFAFTYMYGSLPIR